MSSLPDELLSLRPEAGVRPRAQTRQPREIARGQDVADGGLLLLPTAHPNSVLPYHHPDYEDEIYEYGYENGDGSDLESSMEDIKQGHKKEQNLNHHLLWAVTKRPPPLDALGTPFSVTKKPPPPKIQHHVISSNNNKNRLPSFIEQPRNAYIIKGQAVSLSCKVVDADKAYFTCNSEAMAASDLHREVDKVEVAETAEMAAVTVKRLTLTVTRIMIEEFFGLYTCRCDAWSSRGMASSSNASVEVACKFILLYLTGWEPSWTSRLWCF